MTSEHVGIVSIGRNEGERLRRALQAIDDAGRVQTIYVDSGSTDASVEVARSMGIRVHELDPARPFTAARARNEGYRLLIEAYPEMRYVQFIDGDCELVPGWLDAATALLDAEPDVGAVCGWVRERNPTDSVYNRICDVEWHMGPVGEVTAFGGNVMIRIATLEEAGGWDPRVIAAEDDELAVRLRATGATLRRIDHDCVIHDVDMHHFSQWWKRAKRCGHAYAQVSSMHGQAPEQKFVHEVRNSILWGLAMPVGALALALPTMGLSNVLFARYPAVAIKTALSTRRAGFPWKHSVAWGVSCAISPFPEAVGVAKFYADRFSDKEPEIIEHKGPKS